MCKEQEELNALRITTQVLIAALTAMQPDSGRKLASELRGIASSGRHSGAVSDELLAIAASIDAPDMVIPGRSPIPSELFPVPSISKCP